MLGSWDRAQKRCHDRGAHLWSINSHEEFYHIFTKTHGTLEEHILNFTDPLDDMSSKRHVIFDPSVSPHVFIGLIQETPRKSHTIKVTPRKSHTIKVTDRKSHTIKVTPRKSHTIKVCRYKYTFTL